MKSGYPREWFEIASRVKVVAGWKCEACGRDNGPPHEGAVLTVHHLDGNKMNPERMPMEIPHSNLVALCQVCHLRAEAWTKVGSFVSREYAIDRLREIIEEDSRQGDLPL